MARVEETVDIPVDADSLWRAIGSFQGIGEWHPLLAEVQGTGEQPGATRTASADDGSEQVERLEEVEQRAYRYTMQSSPMSVDGYRAELRVDANADETSTVRWSADFEVTSGDTDETVELVRGFLAAGLESLAERHAAD